MPNATPRNNAARRLVTLAEQIRGAARAQPTAHISHILAAAFGVRGPAGPERDVKVVRLLGLCLDQATEVHRQCESAGYEAQTLQTIATIRNVFNPNNLSFQANQLVQHLGETTIGVLRAVASGGGFEDEEPLSSVQVDDIRSIVEDFRASIGGAHHLPTSVLQFLYRQLEIVESALQEYPIVGLKAFRNASEEAAFEWVRDGNDIASHRESEPVKKAISLWARIVQAAGPIIVVSKAVDSIGNLFTRFALAFQLMSGQPAQDLQLLFDVRPDQALLAPAPSPAPKDQPPADQPPIQTDGPPQQTEL